MAKIELGVSREKDLFHGNLETLRDMTDVRDSSRVMVDLARKKKSMLGSTYNVGSNRAVMRSFIRLIKRLRCRSISPKRACRGASTTCAATAPSRCDSTALLARSPSAGACASARA